MLVARRPRPPGGVVPLNPISNIYGQRVWGSLWSRLSPLCFASILVIFDGGLFFLVDAARKFSEFFAFDSVWVQYCARGRHQPPHVGPSHAHYTHTSRHLPTRCLRCEHTPTTPRPEKNRYRQTSSQMVRFSSQFGSSSHRCLHGVSAQSCSAEDRVIVLHVAPPLYVEKTTVTAVVSM